MNSISFIYYDWENVPRRPCLDVCILITYQSLTLDHMLLTLKLLKNTDQKTGSTCSVSNKQHSPEALNAWQPQVDYCAARLMQGLYYLDCQSVRRYIHICLLRIKTCFGDKSCHDLIQSCRSLAYSYYGRQCKHLTRESGPRNTNTPVTTFHLSVSKCLIWQLLGSLLLCQMLFNMSIEHFWCNTFVIYGHGEKVDSCFGNAPYLQ